jgi:hypothetical protein
MLLHEVASDERDEPRIADEVTLPHPPRLLREPEQPLQAGSL